LTRAELAEILGVTPKAVSKRIERGQELTTPKRYGLVRDVTDEPKRKPAEAVDPVKARRDAIDGIIERTKEPGNLLDQRAQLEAAWDAGHNTGARR
jgi:DNA-binding Lrp family transcriptional regulator